MTQEDARSPQHNLYVLVDPTWRTWTNCSTSSSLVDAGNSVLVIEHNLDVIVEADWIIDMGSEDDSQGGQGVAQGAPETVIKRKRSQTKAFLGKID